MPESAQAAASRLADALQERSARLAAGPVDEMYRDLFWHERFQARGRTHAEQDGLHHVTYLSEAIRLGSPGTLVSYARWLRTLLVAHGMCTLDLVANFERLAGALLAEGLPDAEVGRSYLEAAQRALAYEHGDAAGLWQAQAQLEAAASARVREAGGHDWLSVAASLHADPRHLLSYLTDAVAVARPELLAAHATWAKAALARHGVPAEAWAALTAAVTGACAAENADWSSAAVGCAARAFAAEGP